MTPDAHRHLLLVHARCELPHPLPYILTMHDARRRARLKVGEQYSLYPELASSAWAVEQLESVLRADAS